MVPTKEMIEAADEEQIVATVLAELEEHRSTGDTGGWGTTFHRHSGCNEIHRDLDDCRQGAGRPVYVFDPGYLEEHDTWVIQATLRAALAVAPRTQVDDALMLAALNAMQAEERRLSRFPKMAEEYVSTSLHDWGEGAVSKMRAALEAALAVAPASDGGKRVVIGKESRDNERETWAFTVWEPGQIEEAREKFPGSVYAIVTVFGLPVEGESK